MLDDPKKVAALLRLADVGLAAASVVHEMRQPLSGVKAFAQLLSADPAGTKELAADIVAQAVVMESLLDRLRAYVGVGPEESRPKRAAIDASLDSALGILEGALRKSKTRVEREIAPALPPIALTAAALQQVLVNLLRNALDAAPGGLVRVTAAAHAARVRLVVEDDGPGVPPEFRERLFRPLETTKSDGVGLGLYVSRMIAIDAGGSLELLASRRGAAFALELPQA